MKDLLNKIKAEVEKVVNNNQAAAKTKKFLAARKGKENTNHFVVGVGVVAIVLVGIILSPILLPLAALGGLLAIGVAGIWLIGRIINWMASHAHRAPVKDSE
jgi:uncharacterized membrane protein